MDGLDLDSHEVSSSGSITRSCLTRDVVDSGAFVVEGLILDFREEILQLGTSGNFRKGLPVIVAFF